MSPTLPTTVERPAAADGRRVTAVDVSEVALRLLGDEARRRGLGGLVVLVHADLSAWSPEPGSYALVLCTGFWLSGVFAAAARLPENPHPLRRGHRLAPAPRQPRRLTSKPLGCLPPPRTRQAPPHE